MLPSDARSSTHRGRTKRLLTAMCVAAALAVGAGYGVMRTASAEPEELKPIKAAPNMKGAPAAQPTGEVEFAPLVDWSHARAVYRLADSWRLNGSTDTREKQPTIRVSGVAGVRVTLRRGGITSGVGDAFIPELAVGPASKLIKGDDDLGPTCDLVALTKTATQRAIAAFGQRLAEVRAKNANKDGAKPQGMLDVAPFLTIDIQIAKMPRPIFISPLAEDGAIFETFAPGFHGLRLVRTDQPDLMIQAWDWPASSIASNSTPRTQLLQLLTDVKFDDSKLAMLGKSEPPPPAAHIAPAPAPKPAPTTAPAAAPAPEPALLREKQRNDVLPAVLERFDVLHIARANNQAPELLLTRGNILLPAARIDEQTLRALGERIAALLIRRIRTDGPMAGAMAGTYHPTPDQFEPAIASDEEIALVTLALSRWSKYLAQRDPGNPQQIKTDNAIVAAVNFSYGRAKANPPAVSTVAAMVLRSLVTAPHLVKNKSQRDEMLSAVRACRNADGSFRENSATIAPKLSIAGQALLTSAMAAVYAQNEDPKLGADARQSLELLWRDMDLTKAITALPWIISAEVDLQKVPIPPGELGAAPPMPRAQAINTIVSVLRDRQIVAAPTSGPADVIGGFELTRLPPDAPPNPNWNSAFALDFVARSLRYPNAVAAKDRLSWILTCSLGARFIAQLSIDEPSCYYIRSQPDAMGGVRNALWDNRLAPAPSAISLIATADLLETLAQIEEAGGLNVP